MIASSIWKGIQVSTLIYMTPVYWNVCVCVLCSSVTATFAVSSTAWQNHVTVKEEQTYRHCKLSRCVLMRMCCQLVEISFSNTKVLYLKWYQIFISFKIISRKSELRYLNFLPGFSEISWRANSEFVFYLTPLRKIKIASQISYFNLF